MGVEFDNTPLQPVTVSDAGGVEHTFEFRSMLVGTGHALRRFQGLADAVGRSISIDGIPFTIVGVSPSAFLGPEVGSAFDIAVPFGALPTVLRRDRLSKRNSWWLTVMGRLEPGQTAEAAAAALAPLQPVLRDLTRPPDLRPEEAAGYLGTPMGVAPAPSGPSSIRDGSRPALGALMGIVGLILLIACVSVANLLLTRAERRRGDVSLQLALGASRQSLVSQFLLESLLLSATSRRPIRRTTTVGPEHGLRLGR